MITKKLTTEKLEEFSIWDWRPIAADTFLKVMQVHSFNGKDVPKIEQREIGPGEYAHWFRFSNPAEDMIIVYARGGRTTAFKRKMDVPEPPNDGTSGKK